MISVILKFGVPEKRADDPDDKQDNWPPRRTHLDDGLDPESQILEPGEDPCIRPRPHRLRSGGGLGGDLVIDLT
jgi:hypothetical protein